MEAYYILCSSGVYDDYTTWILGNKIFESYEDAVEICHRYNQKHDKDFLKTRFVGCTYEEYESEMEKALEAFSKGWNSSFIGSEIYRKNEELYQEIEFSDIHEATVHKCEFILDSKSNGLQQLNEIKLD